jgi:hypothetical protein
MTMKETIRNLAKALRQSNRAYECLIQFGDQCLNHFVPLSGSIENPMHRTLLDQFRSQCSIQLYENEKLIFVATKLISEPELMDRPELAPYLAQLGAVDSSLNDGLYGRPIPGFLHPIISESVIDLIHQSSDCSSWEEWKNNLNATQLHIQQLISCFPIQHPVSTILVGLHASYTSITNTITEQEKIEHTLNQLVEHSAEVSHPEHAAHFRLYALRLEQQRLPLPIYLRGDEEE